MTRDLAADVALARQLAAHAGRIAQAHFEDEDFAVRRKSDGTPVTDVDLEVERYVRRQLEIHRPGDAVLGEELGRSGHADAVWIVDPIDGTQNFVDGSVHWGVQVALRLAADVVVGVVDAPLLERRWWAAHGLGAYRDGERLFAARTQALHGALVTRRSAAPPGAHEVPGALRALVGLCDIAGPETFWPELLVAEGVVDIDIGSGGAEWDLAPRSVIVTESGARFTDLGGRAGIASGRALTVTAPLLGVLTGVDHRLAGVAVR